MHQRFAMLSRVANSIYWMSRYVERAENVARFTDVTMNVILDRPSEANGQWEPLVRTTGDEESFSEHYGEFNSRNVRQFLTFDRGYAGSILSSLSYARENARTVREAISSEAWEQLNAFYHFVKAAAQKGEAGATSDFYHEVKQHSHLFNGIVDATMTRGKGWHFANLGRLIERADKTSRILDVKYFTLLPAVKDVGTTIDDLLWSAVLRSVSGFEMFRKRYHALTIHRIVDFLVLDPYFPRSVNFCVKSAAASLHEIGGPVCDADNVAIQRIEALSRRLDATTAEGIINPGMHEFIDLLQTELNGVGDGINDTYVLQKPSDSSLQTQSQSTT